VQPRIPARPLVLSRASAHVQLNLSISKIAAEVTLTNATVQEVMTSMLGTYPILGAMVGPMTIGPRAGVKSPAMALSSVATKALAANNNLATRTTLVGSAKLVRLGRWRLRLFRRLAPLIQLLPRRQAHAILSETAMSLSASQ